MSLSTPKRSHIVNERFIYPPADSAAIRKGRRHDVDWLRVVAVLLLIPFHSAVIFNRYAEWYVTNQTPSLALEAFAYFLSQWRMPLLFFVSGVGTVFALGFRAPRAYIRERAGRLLLPLAFGVLVIVPPQVYLWRRSDPGYDLGYREFYPTFFNGVRPEGNFEWAHLWFLAYLFVFSFLALPLFLYLRGEAGKGLLARVSEMFETPWGIFAPALPLVLVQALLRARWPGFPPNLYDDWANFSFYLILFVYGYALFLAPGFDRALRRRWKASLLLGVGTMSVIYLVLGTGNAPEIGYTPAFVAFAALHGLNTWFWLVAVVGAARTYPGFENRVLRYLRDAVYPTYILHQTVVVAVGFLVVRWELDVPVKFTLIAFASLAVTLVLYELVRRVDVLRPLFGLKPKGRRKAIAVAGGGPNHG